MIMLSFFITFTSLAIQIVSGQDSLFPVNAYWFTNPSTAPYSYMESSLRVPPVPPREWQTLFLWPGLQPLQGGANYYPIDNGVIQPVLTWGPSCAPNPNSLGSDGGWWISGQYVNTFGNAPGYRGCYGGDRMAVNPGDTLRMVMELVPGSTVWRQTISNSNGGSVSFEKDMQGQAQAWAEWIMETPGGWHGNVPQWDVTNIVLRTNGNGSSPEFCRYEQRVASFSGSSLSCTSPIKNGNSCTISSCSFNKGGPSPPQPSSSSGSSSTGSTGTATSSATMTVTATTTSSPTTTSTFSPVVPIPPTSLISSPIGSPTNKNGSNIGSGTVSTISVSFTFSWMVLGLFASCIAVVF